MIADRMYEERPSFRAVKNAPRPKSKIIQLDNYDHIRRQQAALLAGHMLLDGVDLGSIRFMLRIYPLFLEQKTASARQMSLYAKITPQAGQKYVHALCDKGYIKRLNYRTWTISDSYLTQLNRM